MPKMKTYVGVVDRSEPGTAYGVWFPDVSGCFSATDHKDDILSNAKEALKLYIEGAKSIPDPRPRSEIERLPEVLAELRRGCTLLDVPISGDCGQAPPQLHAEATQGVP